ncbi:hypothetical protein [Scytonema hofmannii]|uniref:hypothetical protein n=1 Tax=Scytonema hofmannii TaxID=34078 RepID=UPI00034AE9B8|nr:hypothetical protein [Scytonema hofmannii]
MPNPKSKIQNPKSPTPGTVYKSVTVIGDNWEQGTEGGNFSPTPLLPHLFCLYVRVIPLPILGMRS